VSARDAHGRGDLVRRAGKANGERAPLADSGISSVEGELERLDARAVRTQRRVQIGEEGVSGVDERSLPRLPQHNFGARTH
jgi:hypothetical protein